MHDHVKTGPVLRLAALLPVGALVLGACSVGAERTLKTADVQRQIASQLEAQSHQRPTSVDCPGDIRAQKGQTFHCTLTADDGSTIGATGTVTGSGGKFTFVVDTRVSTPPTSAPARARTNRTGSLADVFAPVPGFRFVDLPPAGVAAFQAAVMSDPAAKAAIRDAAARSVVTQDGSDVGIIAAVAFDERTASLPGFQNGFVQGAAESSGATSREPITLAGQPALFFTSPRGNGVAFAQGLLGLIVEGGGDRLTVEKVMTRLIAGNS